MTDATDVTDQIERDLAATRARMDRRLDELGDKLAPNQLVSDTLTQVTGGNGADFAQSLIAKAKANPIPAALASVGIAWLMASSQNKASRAEPDLPARLRLAELGVVRLQDEHSDVHASRVDDARGQVLGVARDASDTASSYGQRIKEAMASATQSMKETSPDLSSNASGALGRLANGKGGLVGNPVVLGSAAALVGLVLGALIPVSEHEEHALGTIAGRLRSKGRDFAQDVVNRGAQVAGDAVGAVKDSAQAHGLTADQPIGELVSDLKSGELLGHVKQAAQEVAGAGKESIQAQFGSTEGDKV